MAVAVAGGTVDLAVGPLLGINVSVVQLNGQDSNVTIGCVYLSFGAGGFVRSFALIILFVRVLHHVSLSGFLALSG